MSRFLIAPLMVTIVSVLAADKVLAQGAFPAPLPGQSVQADQPPANGGSSPATVTPPMSAFPSNGAPSIGALGPASPVAPGVSRECTDGYTPLREDAERKGKLVTAARERRAPPGEACRLISDYRAAEAKLVKYVEANAAKCTVAAQIAQQLNVASRKTTELQTKVCTLAQQMRKRAPAGPTGDFWPTSTDAPI